MCFNTGRRLPNYDWTYDEQHPFGTVNKRKEFVSNVFAIVSLMLGFATLMAFLPFMNDAIAEFFYENSLVIAIVSLVVYFVVSIMIFCCTPLRKNYFCGIILLVLLTMSMSLMVATQSAFYNFKIVAIAFAITVLITFCITALARFGPCDITSCWLLLSILGMCLFIYGLVVTIIMFIYPIPILHTIFAALAIVLFTLFLWFDLQLIMGGRRYELDPDEYILASAMLFIDIIMIFIYLVEIVGLCFQE